MDVVDCSDSEEPPTKSRRLNNSGNSTQTQLLNTSTASSVGRSTPPRSPSSDGEGSERLTPEPAPKAPKIVGSCNCDDLKPVQCHLETKELWDRFHDLGTEMIITKTGR